MYHAPCKDCPDKVVGCHSSCDKYQEFRKFRDEFREYRAKERQLNEDLWATCRYSKKSKRRKPYADSRGGY